MEKPQILEQTSYFHLNYLATLVIPKVYLKIFNVHNFVRNPQASQILHFRRYY